MGNWRARHETANRKVLAGKNPDSGAVHMGGMLHR